MGKDNEDTMLISHEYCCRILMYWIEGQLLFSWRKLAFNLTGLEWNLEESLLSDGDKAIKRLCFKVSYFFFF